VAEDIGALEAAEQRKNALEELKQQVWCLYLVGYMLLPCCEGATAGVEK
jgi:hypothetical protein